MSASTSATSTPAFTVDAPNDLFVEDRGGIRILALGRGKANALSTEFAAALHRAAQAAQEDPSVRGVVLTSRSPKIFCGGFDLRSLAHAGPEEFGRFVRVFDALFFDLFLLGKPLVAALTGHAVAGGALLAGTADFRFAAEGPGTIGLPEVRLGIHVPRHCVEALRTTVGDQALTRWALLGETMPFAEAHTLGAIDRIVPADRLLEEAIAFAAQLGGASSEVYAAVKRDLRGSAYDRAMDVQPDARKAFVDSWFSEIGQRGLARALHHGSYGGAADVDALLEALGLERRAPDARFFEDLFLRFQRRLAAETLTRSAGNAATFDPEAFFENWIEEERGVVGDERALAFSWLAGQLGFACEVESSSCFRPWETQERDEERRREGAGGFSSKGNGGESHRAVVAEIGGRRILADAGFPMPVLLPLDAHDREFPTGFGTLTVNGGSATVLCDARGEVAELLRLQQQQSPGLSPFAEISRTPPDASPPLGAGGSKEAFALRVLDDRVLSWRAGRMTILDAWSRLEYPLPPSARAALEKLFALELEGIDLPGGETGEAPRPATLSVFHRSPVAAEEARRRIARDARALTLVTAREERVEAADGGSRVSIRATLADVPAEGPGEAVRKTLVFHLVSEIFALAEGDAKAP